MGRYISNSDVRTLVSATTINLGYAAGQLGVFGRGQYQWWVSNSTFVVPSGVTQIRVRVVGGGGSGGSGQAGGDGGSSSFGTLISATGGKGGERYASSAATYTGLPATPGVGLGGDFQATGGPGGPANITQTSNTGGSGGGGAGSQLGPGGIGGMGTLGSVAGSGGGVGGGPGRQGGGGGSPYGVPTATFGAPDVAGNVYTGQGASPPGSLSRFPFDAFPGSGGGPNGQGGSGGGGGTGMAGGQGGGGGGVFGSANPAGPGGIGAGGGGKVDNSGTFGAGGGAGGGFAYGVFSVTPGTSYTVTVGAAGLGNGLLGGTGLVVVEW